MFQWKKGRFAYLRWKILNKILIRTWMLINWVLWLSNLLWEIELYWDGGDCLLQKQNAQGRKRNKGGEKEGWSSDHKLIINDEMTDKIILSVTPSVILLVKISCHRTICLFFNPTIILSVIH